MVKCPHFFFFFFWSQSQFAAGSCQCGCDVSYNLLVTNPRKVPELQRAAKATNDEKCLPVL